MSNTITNTTNTTTTTTIAFVFLVRSRIHPSWKKFFQSSQSTTQSTSQSRLPPNVSIHIHSSDPPTSLAEDDYYPYYYPHPIPTAWGSLSQVEAINLVLLQAYLQTSASLFFHASEACYPLLNLDDFCRSLSTHAPRGYLYYRPDSSRWKPAHKSLGITDPSSFLKMRAQGWAFPRSVVAILLQYRDSLKYFTSTVCPTEHVYVNILTSHGIKLDDYFVNRPLAFFNWDDSNCTKHPKLYLDREVTSAFIDNLISRNYLILRKVQPSLPFQPGSSLTPTPTPTSTPKTPTPKHINNSTSNLHLSSTLTIHDKFSILDQILTSI